MSTKFDRLEFSDKKLYLKFFSTITRHINTNILKDTLRLNILWTWIKMSASSFIETLINIMKQETTKVPWKLSHAKENVTPRLKEHCTKLVNI